MLDKRSQEILEKLKNNNDGILYYKLCDGLLYYKNHVYVHDVSGLWDDILYHFHNSKDGHSG